MAKMDSEYTVKVELSAEDRELLRRVADALERAHPDNSGSFGDIVVQDPQTGAVRRIVEDKTR